MEVPETRYAKTVDGVHIAYQVVGQGPSDLVYVPFDYSNIEANWEVPQYASFVRALSRFARVILMDCRGIGASDRGVGSSMPTIEARMDDIRAVMDAAGSERACLFGIESGATLCFPFAATYPDRTAAIVVFGATAAGSPTEDYPWGWTPEEWKTWTDRIGSGWGSEGVRPGPDRVDHALAGRRPGVRAHDRPRAASGGKPRGMRPPTTG